MTDTITKIEAPSKPVKTKYKPSFLRRLILRYPWIYYEVVFSLQFLNWSMFNYGHAPLSDRARNDPEGIKQPFQAQLYLKVWDTLDRKMSSDDNVVEVSSGKGGGLSVVSRQSDAKVLGLERAFFGRLNTKLRFGLPTKPFTAPNLDLPDNYARGMYSIEAFTNYFSQELCDELYRCLSPGGSFVLAEQRLMSFERQREYLTSAFEKSGFKVTLFENITDGVVESCTADSDRKMRYLRWLPKFVKKAMMETICCDPSDKLNSFRDGRRVFILLKAEKPQD